MPYLKIQTSKPVDDTTRQDILKKASAAVAAGLGKPESYVMVAFDPALPMMFAGSDEPCVYMELKSIGLPESRTAALSETLCALMEAELGIPGKRAYIEFSNAPRAMWGWNRGTF
jgi:phenylpyruvate tautomerase PptA (4-oxalocrotonate tautomerase family)